MVRQPKQCPWPWHAIRVHSRGLAERVGFEPTSPCGRTAFRERRLQPLGNLSNDLNKLRRLIRPSILQHSKLTRTLNCSCQRVGCAQSLRSLRLPRLRRGRRTHVSLRENPVPESRFQTGRLQPLGNLSGISPLAKYI